MKAELEFILEVNQLIEDKDWDRALIKIDEGMEIYTNSPEFWSKRGWIFFVKRRFDLALECYSQAIEKDLSYAKGYNGLGAVHFFQNRYELAIECFCQAIEKDPFYADPEFGLGEVLLAQEKFDLAYEHFKNALMKDTEFALAYYGLGCVCSRKKRYRQAIKLFEKSIAKDPKSPLPDFELGKIYSFQENYHQAIQHFKKSIAKDPDLSHTYKELGDIYYYLTEYDLAIDFYNLSIEKDPLSALPYLGLGNVYSALASEEFFQLINKNQISPKAYFALEQYKIAIINDPFLYFPEHGIARLFRNFGDKRLAIQYYNNAISKAPTDANLEFELGNYLFELQEYSIAIKHYQNSIAKNPNFAYPHYDLGSIFDQQNNLKSAKLHFLRFIDLDGPSEISISRERLMVFFLKRYQRPFVVEELLNKYAYSSDISFKVNEKIQKDVENIHLFLAFLKYQPSTDSTAYNCLLALVNFFADLPYKACRILDTWHRTNENNLPLMGYYYWLESVAAYSAPDNIYPILLETATTKAEMVYKDLGKASIEDVYYAGQIYWKIYLFNSHLSYAQKADNCFSIAEVSQFLPASYMRVCSLKALQMFEEVRTQTDQIKNWERSISEGHFYSIGINKFDLDPFDSDFLAPFIQYARFYELQDALKIVFGESFVLLPDFHMIWQLSKKEVIRPLVKEWKLKDLKNGILQSYIEAVGNTFNAERAKKLRNDELPGINQETDASLESLFTKAKEWSKFPNDHNNSLESHIASFIYNVPRF